MPLFVLPGYRTTNWTLIFHPEAAASLDHQALRIHWSAGLAVLVAMYFLARAVWRQRFDRGPRLGLVVGLGFVFLLSLIAGLATNPNRLNIVYFIQTILPMSGFLAGASLADRVPSLQRVLWLFVCVVTFSIICILLLAFSYGALSSDVAAANRLAKAIPQLQDYFPFIVVASLSLSLGLMASSGGRRRKALLLVAAAIHLSFFAIVWSRMAMIMLALAIIAPVVLASRSTPWGRRVVHAAAVALLLVGIGIIVTQVTVLGTRLQYASGDDNSTVQSDSKRIEYAAEALKMIAAQPILGRQFVPDSQLKVTGSRTEPLRIPRVFRAHNQYLDYGIRAGLPAMALLAAIMWTNVLDLRRALRVSATASGVRPLVVGIAGALFALAAGNLTQLFLVQVQTGSLAWFLMGVTARLPRITGEDTGSPC